MHRDHLFLLKWPHNPALPPVCLCPQSGFPFIITWKVFIKLAVIGITHALFLRSSILIGRPRVTALRHRYSGCSCVDVSCTFEAQVLHTTSLDSQYLRRCSIWQQAPMDQANPTCLTKITLQRASRISLARPHPDARL